MMPHEYDKEIISPKNLVSELNFRINQHRGRIQELEEMFYDLKNREQPSNELKHELKGKKK